MRSRIIRPRGRASLRGVEVRARDAGTVKHVHLKNLEIHDVNGISDYSRDGSTVSKSFGGLITILEGDTTPTAWDDLRIENCEIHDVGPIGIVMLSSWMAGQRDHDEKTWFPSRHVVIRGNKIERTAQRADRAWLRGAAHRAESLQRLRERRQRQRLLCLSLRGRVVPIQRIVLHALQRGRHGRDGFRQRLQLPAVGFPIQLQPRQRVRLYGRLQPGAAWIQRRDDRALQHQSERRRQRVSFLGAITNTKVYNNTIYVGRDVRSPRHSVPPRIIYQKSWNDGWSDHLTFFNNAIYNACPRAVYAEGKSTNNVYCHNLFFGLHPASEPADALKSLMNPLFTKPGGAKLGRDSAAEAYAALPGAPEFGAARAWENQAKNGFRGGGLDMLPDISPPAGCGPSSAIEKPDAPPTERRTKTGM